MSKTVKAPTQRVKGESEGKATLGAQVVSKSKGSTTQPKRHVVQFYSKSKKLNDLDNLPPRLVDKNWRYILSNFHPIEIEINGDKYHTPEHAFHAAKCKCSNKPKVYKHFTVTGDIAKDPKSAKLAGGRKGFEKLGGKDLKLDVKKWNAEKLKENMAILEARWEQDADFREVLSAVHAKIKSEHWYLLHFERSGTKAEWGGSYSEVDGVKGKNLLGKQLMELARQKLDGNTVSSDVKASSGGSTRERKRKRDKVG
mmetsp:Transcript_11204/g.16684  ORF Transcript_11204/g.16684 Transcript_11204/m.16684 type:complete len:255 (-) Transcript_11204:452-1216(-)